MRRLGIARGTIARVAERSKITAPLAGHWVRFFARNEQPLQCTPRHLDNSSAGLVPVSGPGARYQGPPWRRGVRVVAHQRICLYRRATITGEVALAPIVDLEHLKRLGRRASEIGRLRRAVRISWPVLPVAAVCLLEPRGRGTCAIAALTLLGWTIWLRWRNQQGHEIATTGLLAGSIPLMVGIIQERLHGGCADSEVSCIAFIVLGGVCAGALIVLRDANWESRPRSWVMASGIAALVASLGCVRLGSVGFVSAALGIMLGASAAALAGRKLA